MIGEISWVLGGWRPGSATGVFGMGARTNQYGADYQTGPDAYAVKFNASQNVPTGAQNVPPHIWEPVILYLGRAPQI